MRGSHPQDGELKSTPHAATLGKVALATNPCEAAMRKMANSIPCPAQSSSERSPQAINPCEAAKLKAPPLPHVC